MSFPSPVSNVSTTQSWPLPSQENPEKYLGIATAFFWISALCAVGTLGGIVATLLCGAGTTILLAVVMIGGGGAIFFFSITVYLMNKIDEHDAAELEKLNQRINGGGEFTFRSDVSETKTPAPLPDKDRVLADFKANAFRELLNIDYNVWEAFERGDLSCSDSAVQEKFAAYVKTATLSELFFNYHQEYYPQLFPESCREAALNLIARQRALVDTYNQRLGEMSAEKIAKQQKLTTEHKEKTDPLYRRFEVLAAEIPKLTAFIARNSNTALQIAIKQNLVEEEKEIPLQLITLEKAYQARLAELEADQKRQKEGASLDYQKNQASLETEWKALQDAGF